MGLPRALHLSARTINTLLFPPHHERVLCFVASYRYGAHGIDLDWEYPCSPKRENPVKISCSKFQSVDDTGGSCPADTDNLLALMQVRERRPTT
jgi:GH18 family chitinase